MSDPFSMTTDMRMLAGIKIKMMTLTIFIGSSIRANLPSRGARGKIKKIITGQKLILEMLEPIKKQQNETQNCVPSDGVREGATGETNVIKPHKTSFPIMNSFNREYFGNDSF